MCVSRCHFFFHQLWSFELLHVLGLALFTFKVLPQMDAVKGAMLTNSICFIPAVLSEFLFIRQKYICI